MKQTITEVLAQSILPYKWVIVDDSSIDDRAGALRALYGWQALSFRK